MYSHLRRHIQLTFWTLLCSFGANATVFYSQQEAMELAFGKDAVIEMQQLFPSDEQIRSMQELAHTKLDSKMLTLYVGKKQETVLGYAAIETHIVRTKPETLLVVLSPTGELSQIETLAFHEPPEYQPPQNWYALLLRRLLPDLQYGTSVHAISGATLSARSAIESVRKVLAVYEIMLKPGLL